MHINTNIGSLGLRKVIEKELVQNNIVKIGQLCEMRKSEILQLGLKSSEVEQIEIKLQLQGLDIKR